MQYLFAKPDDIDFQGLCGLLDEELNQLAGGVDNRKAYIPLNDIQCLHSVMIAYDGEIPAGCGAIKVYGGETAELKRFYVKPEFRKQHIGLTMLAYLEEEARKAGFQKIILETGEPLTAAVALYQKAGFDVMENYGPYKNMAESLCMKKVL